MKVTKVTGIIHSKIDRHNDGAESPFRLILCVCFCFLIWTTIIRGRRPQFFTMTTPFNTTRLLLFTVLLASSFGEDGGEGHDTRTAISNFDGTAVVGNTWRLERNARGMRSSSSSSKAYSSRFGALSRSNKSSSKSSRRGSKLSLIHI